MGKSGTVYGGPQSKSACENNGVCQPAPGACRSPDDIACMIASAHSDGMSPTFRTRIVLQKRTTRSIEIVGRHQSLPVQHDAHRDEVMGEDTRDRSRQAFSAAVYAIRKATPLARMFAPHFCGSSARVPRLALWYSTAVGPWHSGPLALRTQNPIQPRA